ncbi:ATP-binding cassette domain-containing protein [Sphingomonas sp. AR_OL41]|uniref:ABC transporter ATP-binding protein n=1 Tax=Sphingomonas sp. AR_OL41 TaxID=3042729 RepID=UPI00248042AE|nr:ATP-binding cassette domain-containing protein [Sphingomonas sp. AR_OL41]MDH7975924.1 ATP-binding cassette domain-containing protein [Sphingomonas sp. AR_OL41]
MSAPLVLDELGHHVAEGAESKPTLDPLTRTFEAGAFHVVSGPSGSGKTTLLSILSLAVRAERGTLFHGHDTIGRLPPAAADAWRRKHVGMVFQTSRLMRLMTVSEHIRLAAATRGAPEAIAHGHALLGTLGLGDRLAQRPTALSGGEKQRVALAQAMCFRPAILLADEPTAALGIEQAGAVALALRDYARTEDAVVICVSHDIAVIDLADHNLVLAKPSTGNA